MTAWKKYRRSDSPRDRAGKPELAIWKKGTVAFTKASEEKYGVSDYKFAEMMFDNETNKIAIKPQSDRSNPDELLTITKGRSNISIAAHPFFKEFKIKIDKTRRYDIEEEDDLLVVRLTKPSS